MGDLPLDERFRNYSDHVAAGFYRGIRQNAHQSDVPAAIDQTDSAVRQFSSKVTCSMDVVSSRSFVRAAEDADAVHRSIRLPPTIVNTALPCRFRPAKGVLRD